MSQRQGSAQRAAPQQQQSLAAPMLAAHPTLTAQASAPTASLHAHGSYRAADGQYDTPQAPRLRTLLDLASDASAPNHDNARAQLQERSAIFGVLALQCECLLRQAGIAVPPETAYSEAARIMARLGARG